MKQAHANHAAAAPAGRHYLMFGVNMVLSFIAMYLVMFSMIDGWGDFRHNLNTFYMALAMVAPMGIVMLATMGGMYPHRRLNLALHLALALMFAGAVGATRKQTLVDDAQFVASMIPHHSGAILMCREASLRDAELRQLCQAIVGAQRAEIRQMEAIAARLRGGAAP